MDCIKNRRTIRKYKQMDVPSDLLNKLFAEAFRASTMGNMQLYSVVITRDPQMKAKLSPAHFNQPMVMGAPVVLTFCADFNRFERWCEISNAVPGYKNFQSFMTAVLDTVIFAQQFCTIAEMKGLGCCYLGTTTYNAPEIAEVLQLPDRVVPVVTLTVGYPEGESVVSDRIPVEGIIHCERYDDYSDEFVAKLYAEKEARDDSKSFVAENKKQTLAQVFTDVRYTREANDCFSKIYRDFIEEKGFEFPK